MSRRWATTASAPRQSPALPAYVTREAPGEPPAGALLLTGIATTRGWGTAELPLAAGLQRLDGSTTYFSSGLDPRRIQNDPPFPLLWRHEWDKPIGEMFRLYATADALWFNAWVAPVGMAGYDAGLLAETWAKVRAEEALCVSFATDGCERGDPFDGVELSLCPRGANPFAVVTRAEFPDGHEVRRDLPRIDEAMTRSVSHEFYRVHAERHAQKHGTLQRSATDESAMLRARLEVLERELAEVRARAPAPPVVDNSEIERLRAEVAELRSGAVRTALADAHRGKWLEHERYTPGDLATWGGNTWLCADEVVGEEPGKSAKWKLFAQRGRDGRDRRF